MKTLIITLLTLLTITSCDDIESAEIEQVIQGRWDVFIENWEEENAKACAEFYTSDGLNIPPESSAKNGIDEIEEFYQFLFDNNLESDYTNEILSIDVCGNSLVELGSFEVDWTRNDSTSWTYYARSIAHWEKNDEGIWMIKKLLFNNPPE